MKCRFLTIRDESLSLIVIRFERKSSITEQNGGFKDQPVALSFFAQCHKLGSDGDVGVTSWSTETGRVLVALFLMEFQQMSPERYLRVGSSAQKRGFEVFHFVLKLLTGASRVL